MFYCILTLCTFCCCNHLRQSRRPSLKASVSQRPTPPSQPTAISNDLDHRTDHWRDDGANWLRRRVPGRVRARQSASQETPRLPNAVRYCTSHLIFLCGPPLLRITLAPPPPKFSLSNPPHQTPTSAQSARTTARTGCVCTASK